MSPILGIIASQNYVRIPTTGFVSIATTTVGSGGSTSISFSGISGSYKHLQLRAMGYMTTNENIYLRLNGNDGTKGHTLQGDGTSIVAEDYNNTIIYAHRATSGRFAFVTDILDYSTTTKNKTIRSLAGGDDNGAGRITLASGFYDSTSAITSFTLVGSSGGSFTQYSSFALYGIQG